MQLWWKDGATFLARASWAARRIFFYGVGYRTEFASDITHPAGHVHAPGLPR